MRPWQMLTVTWACYREAAYLFVQYLRPEAKDVEFDPPCPLFSRQEDPNGLHILELGSGVGLVGLACAQELRSFQKGKQRACGDVVVLTDLENVCDLMWRNAEAAGFSKSAKDQKALSSNDAGVDVLVRPLAWGNSTHATQVTQELAARRQQGLDECTSPAKPVSSLNYIFCSDLVYFTELLAPLLRSLIQLTSETPEASQCPTVIIAYKIRSMAKEEPFWIALGHWFDVEVVNVRSKGRRGWGPWHRFGSLRQDLAGNDGDCSGGDDETAIEDAYFLFIAKRKSETIGRRAPEQDAQLMAGMMLAAVDDSKGSDGNSTVNELVQGTGGADFLEWALMSDMTL